MFAFDSNILVYAHNLASPFHINYQLNTLLTLLESTTTRKKIFDFYLAATLKDHGTEGLYTVNVHDFKEFTFLKFKNPLK